MRLRGKNSLPLTPKTVHLLRLPRTIGKSNGLYNKFFSDFMGESCAFGHHNKQSFTAIDRLSVALFARNRDRPIAARYLVIVRLVSPSLPDSEYGVPVRQENQRGHFPRQIASPFENEAVPIFVSTKSPRSGRR